MRIDPIQTRSVRVQVGDSLRLIALRELGDALRWVELAEINGLRPPYVVASTDPGDRQPKTAVYGDAIRIPVGREPRLAQPDDDVFGIDLSLAHGRLDTASGDLLAIAGTANLRQAIRHRVNTGTGEMVPHPAYGCAAKHALGLRNTHVQALLVAGYVLRALQQEPRVARAQNVVPYIEGDTIHVRGEVMPRTENTALDLNLVFPVAR